MGCAITCGKIKGKVEPEQILDFIRKNYDKKSAMSGMTVEKDKISECGYDKIYVYDKNKEYYISKSGIICNSIIDDLFYSYSNMNFYSDLKYYEYRGLSDMVGVETTYVGMPASNKSVEIIKSIIANFGGGWIDENDCDDDDYYYVDGNGNVKSVKHVTLEEVYEKFGEIVVIDNFKAH